MTLDHEGKTFEYGTEVPNSYRISLLATVATEHGMGTRAARLSARKELLAARKEAGTAREELAEDVDEQEPGFRDALELWMSDADANQSDSSAKLSRPDMYRIIADQLRSEGESELLAHYVESEAAVSASKTAVGNLRLAA